MVALVPTANRRHSYHTDSLPQRHRAPSAGLPRGPHPQCPLLVATITCLLCCIRSEGLAFSLRGCAVCSVPCKGALLITMQQKKQWIPLIEAFQVSGMAQAHASVPSADIYRLLTGPHLGLPSCQVVGHLSTY